MSFQISAGNGTLQFTCKRKNNYTFCMNFYVNFFFLRHSVIRNIISRFMAGQRDGWVVGSSKELP